MLFMRQAAEPQAHVESGSVRTFLYLEDKELSKSSCRVGALGFYDSLFHALRWWNAAGAVPHTSLRQPHNLTPETVATFSLTRQRGKVIVK